MVTVRRISAGIRALLRSEAIRADLARRAEAVAAAAGEGHITDSEIGRNRARAAVITATGKAMRNEAENRSLTRAIDAAR